MQTVWPYLHFKLNGGKTCDASSESVTKTRPVLTDNFNLGEPRAIQNPHPSQQTNLDPRVTLPDTDTPTRDTEDTWSRRPDFTHAQSQIYTHTNSDRFELCVYICR